MLSLPVYEVVVGMNVASAFRFILVPKTCETLD